MEDEFKEARIKFREESISSWNKGINLIFPKSKPSYCEWTGSQEIANVLSIVGSCSNHTFFPTGGGLDLLDAKISEEANCIDLNFGGEQYNTMKPKKLIFVGHNRDVEWSFFYLELDDLKSTGVYEDTYPEDVLKKELRREELVLLPNGNLLPRIHWDEGFMYNEYGEEVDLPQGSKMIVRTLNGNFVIFAKGSLYNEYPATYNAFQDKLKIEDFSKLISEMKEVKLAWNEMM